jgi:hypothetical protein
VPWNIWFYPILITSSMEYLVLSYADYRNIWFYSVVITSSMEHIVISCADPWGIKLVSTAGQNWLKSWFNFL